MTLPASGLISLTDVLNELKISNPGRALPISLGDSDVRALAGIPSGPIGLSDLYGKTSLAAYGINDSTAFTSSGAGGNATSRPRIVVTAGSGNYSYFWMLIYQDVSVALSNITASQCTVAKTFAKNAVGSFHAILQCTVTDNIGGGSIIINNIVADASWDV